MGLLVQVRARTLARKSGEGEQAEVAVGREQERADAVEGRRQQLPEHLLQAISRMRGVHDPGDMGSPFTDLRADRSHRAEVEDLDGTIGSDHESHDPLIVRPVVAPAFPRHVDPKIDERGVMRQQGLQGIDLRPLPPPAGILLHQSPGELCLEVVFPHGQAPDPVPGGRVVGGRGGHHGLGELRGRLLELIE
jgi:hypothetical protein